MGVVFTPGFDCVVILLETPSVFVALGAAVERCASKLRGIPFKARTVGDSIGFDGPAELDDVRAVKDLTGVLTVD
jgi:hypothetical protein